MDNMTFEHFAAAISRMLNDRAKEKGYNSTGTEGPNELYSFVSSLNDGPGHALGEIIYKATRYKAKKDKSDLLKIAAWAFLIWRYDENEKH